MANSAKRDKAAAEVQRRRSEALVLRTQGFSLAKIAEAIGLSVTRCSVLISEELRNIPKEAADAKRAIEEQRMDRLLAAVWRKALAGDLSACMVALKIGQERRKMLGLDAPARNELTGADGGPIELQSLHDELLSRISRLAADGAAGVADPKPDPE